MVLEGLSSLLVRAENLGLLKGIKAFHLSPSVNHLLFACDCLIFCEASLMNDDSVLKFFKQYEHVLGQKVNLEKSGIFLVLTLRRI